MIPRDWGRGVAAEPLWEWIAGRSGRPRVPHVGLDDQAERTPSEVPMKIP